MSLSERRPDKPALQICPEMRGKIDSFLALVQRKARSRKLNYFQIQAYLSRFPDEPDGTVMEIGWETPPRFLPHWRPAVSTVVTVERHYGVWWLTDAVRKPFSTQDPRTPCEKNPFLKMASNFDFYHFMREQDFWDTMRRDIGERF